MTDAVILAICPWCSEPLNRAHYIAGDFAQPSSKDVSICAHCGKIGIFTEELTLRKPTLEEADEVLAALRSLRNN